MSATSQVAGKPMDLGKLTGPNRSTERQNRPDHEAPHSMGVQSPGLPSDPGSPTGNHGHTGSCVSTKTSTGQGLVKKLSMWDVEINPVFEEPNFFMGNRCDSGNSGLYLSSQTIGSRFTDRYRRTPIPAPSGALGSYWFRPSKIAFVFITRSIALKSGCLKRFHSVTKISASASLIAAY